VVCGGRLLLPVVVVLVLVGLGVWVLWPSAGPAPQPRARQYLAFTACLLTDGRGIAGQRAAPAWAGMQDASLATRVKVQFLPAAGAATAADASAYLASLVQRHCDLIVAVGEAPVAAVAADAAKYPDARFIAVGGVASAPNVTAVGAASGSQVRERVAALVRAAVGR
jgi:basic membrane lipoprotein Med (substrate-binding protein (PBP1-ABC) superfamily)